MDPLTGVGLAACIVQLVTFGIQTVKTCQQVYDKGSVSELSNLDDTSGHLARLSSSLQQSLQGSGKGSQALSGDEKDLVDLGRKCQDCADKLQQKLRKLQTERRASVLVAVKQGVRTILKRNSIDKIQKELQAYQLTLETSLLFRLSQRFDFQSLRNDESFARLDKTLQHVIACLADSQTSLTALVVQESEETRLCITRQRDRIESLHRCGEILHSLSYDGIHARQEQVDRHFDGIKNSYDWIFDEPRRHCSDDTPQWDDFAGWLKSGHGLYWINGKAGSGKSTLMNHICTHKRRLELLGEWCSTPQLLTPAFFFWSSGDPLQKSIDGLLRSLLYQMLTEYRELVGCFGNGPPRTWTTSHLRNTLLNLLTQSQVPVAVCMFIDGLDEFEGPVDTVINMITDLADQTHVKVCVSSRPLLGFERAFGGKQSLRLQDLTFDIIREYAENKLSRLIQERVSLDGYDGYQAQRLLDEIVWQANGVFLWVVIAIREVREGLQEAASMDELSQLVESLPPELEKLFMRLLNRIKPVYKRDALRYLQIVLHLYLHVHHGFGFKFGNDLCTVYFSHSQQRLRDTPFVHKEIARSELVAGCRSLKTRLLSHTAGLLELTQESHRDRIYGEEQDLDPLLFTKVHFIHKTVQDFLLDNAEFKSSLAREGLTEAQACLSIARGTLSQLTHFAHRDPTIADNDKPSPVYEPLLASLQQISLVERSLGAAQVALMNSLDFATFTRAWPVVDHVSGRYGKVEAFMIENIGETSIDLVGMAANVGMTLYVCEQLNLPIESRRYFPSLPNPDVYCRNRAAAATLCWNGANQLQYPGSFLVSGLNYRQALEKCLQWETSERSSGGATALMDDVPLAETYLLRCCKPSCLELVRILLGAGANPMVQVKCLPRDEEEYTTKPFWDSWLEFLSPLVLNEDSDEIFLGDDDHEENRVSSKDVIDITKALLFHGADINYYYDPRVYVHQNRYFYFQRRGSKNERIDLMLSHSAVYMLEDYFANEPEFCDFFTAMKPLLTTPIVGIVLTDHRNRLRWGSKICPNAEESKLLWRLVCEWERTERRDDLDSLQAAIKVVYRAHRPDWDSERRGIDSTTDNEDDDSGDDDSEGEDWSDGSDRADDEDNDSHRKYGSDDSHRTDGRDDDSHRGDGSDSPNGGILDD